MWSYAEILMIILNQIFLLLKTLKTTFKKCASSDLTHTVSESFAEISDIKIGLKVKWLAGVKTDRRPLKIKITRRSKMLIKPYGIEVTLNSSLSVL